MPVLDTNHVPGLPHDFPDLLKVALEKLDAGDLDGAFQISDRACNLTDTPDINALLLRASIHSKRGYLAEAIADLRSASLAAPGNQKIALSLIGLCRLDLKNQHDIFKLALVALLRLNPKLSLNSEVANWILDAGFSAMGAAWRKHGIVEGWAIDMNDPAATLLIELDHLFFPTTTGMPTPWLAAAGIGNGLNGFRLKLPEAFTSLRIGISGNSLWGCPVSGNVLLNHKIPSTSTLSDEIDIIVPVHSGYDETLACLDSIKASNNKIRSRVVVVDDCSPDTKLRNALKQRASNKDIILINRPINAGFAGAVNMGLGFDETRDVVVLNADTLVFGDWLDRLHNAAYQDKDIATVTPISNNGELLSHPEPMKNNTVSSTAHAEKLDHLFSQLGPERALDIPVGVGFCIYIKRRSLQGGGLFDEGTFGRGYGEDTDLCLRLQTQGWRNVCAANTFVVHWGSRSFGDEKKHLVAENLQRLHVKYPDHAKAYDQFLDSDPLHQLRRKVQRHFLSQVAPFDGEALHLCDEDERFYLKPSEKCPGQWQVSLTVTGITGVDTIAYAWPEQSAELKEDILAFGFQRLELKTFGEFPAEIIDQLTNNFISFSVTLEDFSGYCPRKYRLIRNAALCSDPADIEVCADCVANLGPLVYGYRGMRDWQERTQTILARAEKISAISEEILTFYCRRFPSIADRITLVECPAKLQFAAKPDMDSDKIFRVAVLSARSLPEGYWQLIEQAVETHRKQLPVEFIVFGETLNDVRLQHIPNIRLVGEASKDQIGSSLRLHGCNAIASYSPCPHIKKRISQFALAHNLPLVDETIAA
jgi:GT2 family glycosyltransferase